MENVTKLHPEVKSSVHKTLYANEGGSPSSFMTPVTWAVNSTDPGPAGQDDRPDALHGDPVGHPAWMQG